MLSIREPDVGVYQWLYRTIKKQYWRVATFADFDDLVQDGLMTYVRVANRYQHVTERKHLMRLFQISFTNHLHDLALKRTRAQQTVANLEYQMVEEQDDGDLLWRLAHAPEPVKSVLLLHMSEANRARLRKPYRMYSDGQRETLNERWCRILKLDPTTINLPLMVREYLTS
jgi:DNA-directed RNA polymerase specialized sigma24 family protein